MDSKEKLLAIRGELDSLDNQLISLFERRMQISDKVAEIKREGNIGLTDEKREQAIVDRAVSLVDTEYKGETIAYMRSLMGLSKLRQRKQLLDHKEEEPLLPEAREPVTTELKIAYQGLPGAWGEQAAVQYFGETEREGLGRFEDVFIAVKNKKYHYLTSI